MTRRRSTSAKRPEGRRARTPEPAVSRQDVESVARTWLEARADCDLERLAKLTSEEAVWVSPVEAPVSGRAAVVEQVRAGFADTDDFATELLSLECRENKAVATIRNTGRRNGDVLDSLQSLLLSVRDGRVTDVRIAVDDPDAVEAFWRG